MRRLLVASIFLALYIPLAAASSLTTPGPDSQCSPADRWPQGPGDTLKFQQPDKELACILQEIDPSRLRATIEKLVSFGTRHTLSTQTDPKRGVGAARDWIASEFHSHAAKSHGRMNVTVQSYIQDPADRIPFNVNISNVFATLTGSVNPDRVYVISGHYDSRNSDPLNFMNDAPGADDDASGVAISMELARIMSTRKSDATIVFTAVAGEEQGLYGSDHMAKSFRAAGIDVQGMLNNDIVGSPVADDGKSDPNVIRMFTQGVPSTENATQVSQRVSLGAENDSPTRQLGRFVAEVATNSLTKMSVQLMYRPDRFLRGGDHRSWLNQGYAAVRFTEPHENYAHQHQDVRVENGVQFGDLIQFCDFDFLARVARVNAAALWSLAQAPGTPQNVTIDSANLTNNSTLRWNDDPLATGYEVVWRSTDEPMWTNIISVGKTNVATIQLSKDNVQFGVRAVGKNAYKSPATYPTPLP